MGQSSHLSRVRHAVRVDSLLRLLAREWSLQGPVVVGATRPAWGRRVVVVDTEAGRVAVKVFDEAAALGLVGPSDEEIEQCLSVLDYLEGRKFEHAPRLIRTRAGHSHVRHAGRVVYVLEWTAGATPPPTARTYDALGRVAARLNSYRDFPYAYPIPIDATIAELHRTGGVQDFGPLYGDLVDGLGVLVDEPCALIHGEINHMNALVDGERLVLLDWDAAGTGPWSLDAGYPLITQFVSEDLTFDAAMASAFYAAYSDGRSMSGDETEQVFAAAMLHALRHLRFGDQRKRWRRVGFAHTHKDELLAAITAPAVR